MGASDKNWPMLRPAGRSANQPGRSVAGLATPWIFGHSLADTPFPRKRMAGTNGTGVHIGASVC
jgi:hypothetical protein